MQVEHDALFAKERADGQTLPKTWLLNGVCDSLETLRNASRVVALGSFLAANARGEGFCEVCERISALDSTGRPICLSSAQLLGHLFGLLAVATTGSALDAAV
jgi:hypothetical protein